MAPAALRSSALIHSPLRLRPMTMRPRRLRRSARSMASDMMTMSSLAGVMSKDACRVTPSILAPRPVTIWRRARSLTSSTRGQVMVPVGRHDAGASGASGSALDAEGGAHGRLAQSQDGLLAQAGEPLGQSDGRGGLALPERRRRDRSDDDVVRATRTTAAHVLAGFQCPQVDLGHITAIGNDVLGSYSR